MFKINDNISHYSILEKLGAGGMGVVYKAEDTKLKRTVALKFLPPELTRDEETKKRFIHEAQTTSSLEHINICNIHEIDQTEDGQLFIAMAYYEGESLKKKIEGEKLLSIDDILDIATQIAHGLTIAHESKIIHRDLKPANIMITNREEVKIVDFGLAKLAGQTKLTKEGTTLGTVAYMSPEQTRGEEVDHRSDIWQLGVILYEMITGQLPFRGDYDQAVVYSITNEDPEPVTGLRSGVPLELERIVNRTLSKDPQDRYQHIDDLLSELNRLRKESDSQKSLTKITPEKKKKYIILIPAIILSIVVLIIAGNFLLQLSQSGKEESSSSEWKNSIAVLPFADLSHNKEQEYFCDGMTDKILTNLSKLKVLKVIARTSVMKYKKTDKTIPEIGKELGVENVLEGSIFKSGDRIRVTAQLINSSSGAHLWADDYEKKLDDVFDIQDDISEKIASNLVATLSPKEKKEIIASRPSNTEVYEYYMKGIYFHLNKFFSSKDIEDFLTSEKMFKTAIKLDPKFADSYAGLADLYNLYYNMLPDTASQKIEYMKLQEAYLDTAYQIDPNSAEVNFAKGCIHNSKNEDKEAFHSFKTAINLNRNNAKYFREIGLFLYEKGCTNLAIQCYTRAINLNPLIPWYYQMRGLFYNIIGETDNTIEDYKKALELNPNHYSTLASFWFVLIYENRNNEADGLLAQMENKFPAEKLKYGHAYQYAIKGQKEKAINYIKSELWIARVHIYLLLNLKNEAFSTLFEATEQYKKTKVSKYHLLQKFVIFDSLRYYPRFQEILTVHKKIYEENLAKYGDIDI